MRSPLGPVPMTAAMLRDAPKRIEIGSDHLSTGKGTIAFARSLLGTTSRRVGLRFVELFKSHPPQGRAPTNRLAPTVMMHAPHRPLRNSALVAIHARICPGMAALGR